MAVGLAPSSATASTEPVGERERLQEELKKAESIVAALEAAAQDSDVQTLIVQKKAHTTRDDQGQAPSGQTVAHAVASGR